MIIDTFGDEEDKVVYQTDDVTDAVELAEAENAGLWMAGSIGDFRYAVINNETGVKVRTVEPNWNANKLYVEEGE